MDPVDLLVEMRTLLDRGRLRALEPGELSRLHVLDSAFRPGPASLYGRAHRRFAVSRWVTAVAGDDAGQVRLADLSPAGARLASRAFQVGERIHLVLHGSGAASVVAGRVLWRREDLGILGVGFLEPRGRTGRA